MLPGSVQVLAFGLALLGLLGAVAAAILPTWQVSPAGAGWPPPPLAVAGPVAGLRVAGLGALQLRAEGARDGARRRHVARRFARALGLLLAALGLKCTRWGGGRRAKGATAVAAGGCLLLAGLLCMAPAAILAREPPAPFRSGEQNGGAGFRPGGALGLALASAGLLLAGGAILCLSCPGGGGVEAPGLPGGGGAEKAYGCRRTSNRNPEPPPQDPPPDRLTPDPPTKTPNGNRNPEPPPQVRPQDPPTRTPNGNRNPGPPPQDPPPDRLTPDPPKKTPNRSKNPEPPPPDPPTRTPNDPPTRTSNNSRNPGPPPQDPPTRTPNGNMNPEPPPSRPPHEDVKDNYSLQEYV
ncbi:LOW QUALITY PROTEIN: uncharacterized protein ACNS7B_002079 [Menidia menidia]